MLGLLLNSHEANLHSAVGYRLPEEFERDPRRVARYICSAERQGCREVVVAMMNAILMKKLERKWLLQACDGHLPVASFIRSTR